MARFTQAWVLGCAPALKREGMNLGSPILKEAEPRPGSPQKGNHQLDGLSWGHSISHSLHFLSYIIISYV